ncbi:LAMI_0E15258g1_1 [Lachancea mirantina]|uniref:LAMI_0E15258g1_1 n=1 Tax=Lachancea mirantina TaxID=1230905 RepID=A0A1G4JSF6_9SACH|nr:LAMI_0E15258g1_1 [Lachancea mirantina]
MVKPNKSKRGEDRPTGDDYGFNEVDSFAKKREKILLDEARIEDEMSEDDERLMEDDEEEEVLGVEEHSGSEDEELDGQKAYREVFGRNLQVDGSENEDGGDMLENENAWGSTKNEYYGADDLEDEEDAKEIEQEALRQQKKHLEDLNMGDYLDEGLDEEWEKNAKEFDVAQFQASGAASASEAVGKDVFKMSTEAKQELLKTSFPEFFPLANELASLVPLLEDLKVNTGSSAVSRIKALALSAYLGTVVSYFSILRHEFDTNEEFHTMKHHPLMESILSCKEIWRQAQELPEVNDGASQDNDEEQLSEDEILEHGGIVEELDEKLLQTDSDQGELDSEAEAEGEVASDNDEEDFEIDVSRPRWTKAPDNRALNSEMDDFVEDEIADVDALDKKARKKTLRFYTSKIDQQENKKGEKFKGDDDIPYKERLFERQQRLLEEARKRGQQGSKDAELDGNDLDSDDENTASALKRAFSTDYYAQVQKARQDRKDSRQQAHKQALLAAREGGLAELADVVGQDGKRAINYQILKNKGLTPKRKKDNRNSRVKKRKKFDKAKKKLKSVRAVYSGGQSSAYEGEKTGIKKNVTRSVKFRS